MNVQDKPSMQELWDDYLEGINSEAYSEAVDQKIVDIIHRIEPFLINRADAIVYAKIVINAEELNNWDDRVTDKVEVTLDASDLKDGWKDDWRPLTLLI